MWESHRITAFQVLGKEKALTVLSPTLIWFLSGQPHHILRNNQSAYETTLRDGFGKRIRCPWMIISDDGLHHALSSFFDSLHYSTYCLGRLATFGDIR